MTNTYLLEVIKALRPDERQGVALFLESPFFNQQKDSEDLIKLYRILLDAAPEFSKEALDKERVYFQLFPDKTVVKGKLEKLMVHLNKQLRSFALVSGYLSEKREMEHQIQWSGWLRERGLTNRAIQVLDKVKETKSSDNSESMEGYRMEMLIAQEDHLRLSTYNMVTGDLGIPKFIRQLDLYHLNLRIELGTQYRIQQRVAALPDLNMAAPDVQSYQEHSALLKISHKIFDIICKTTPPVEEVETFMQQLREHEHKLSQQTRIDFYAYLRNFWTLIINSGKEQYMHLLHDIHKDCLERGYFFFNGEISPHAFSNIIRIGLKVRKFDWVKKFMNEYKSIIIGGDQDQFFYRLNMAQCLFEEGQFEDALGYLPQTASIGLYRHMLRRLELKLYYELKSALLPYKMEAFRKLILRSGHKELSTSLREMNLNFLNMLLQLSQSPLKDRARATRLVQRIEQKEFIADRIWLLEKARELA